MNVLLSTVDSELTAIAPRRCVRGNEVLAASLLKTPEVTLDESAPLERADSAACAPTTRLVGGASRPENWAFPVIVKPRRGDGSLFTANSLVENRSAVYWLIPRAVLSVAIVAALVVFRKVSPL